MNIINASFYAGLAYSISFYLIPTHGSLLVVTITSTCLTFGFRFFGLGVMAPFIVICFFFTWHIHYPDLRSLDDLNSWGIFVCTHVSTALYLESPAENKKALLPGVLSLWVSTILFAKRTFVLAVLLLQFAFYYTMRIFEMYVS